MNTQTGTTAQSAPTTVRTYRIHPAPYRGGERAGHVLREKDRKGATLVERIVGEHEEFEQAMNVAQGLAQGAIVNVSTCYLHAAPGETVVRYDIEPEWNTHYAREVPALKRTVRNATGEHTETLGRYLELAEAFEQTHELVKYATERREVPVGCAPCYRAPWAKLTARAQHSPLRTMRL